MSWLKRHLPMSKQNGIIFGLNFDFCINNNNNGLMYSKVPIFIWYTYHPILKFFYVLMAVNYSILVIIVFLHSAALRFQNLWNYVRLVFINSIWFELQFIPSKFGLKTRLKSLSASKTTRRRTKLTWIKR